MWHLIERCWADNRADRPKFEEVAKVIDPWTIPVTPKSNSALRGRNPEEPDPVKNQPSIEPSYTPTVLDEDLGSPRRIPGTDCVISADDFEADHAPGFGTPSVDRTSEELTTLTKTLDDVNIPSLAMSKSPES
jgi:hypothetical protein